MDFLPKNIIDYSENHTSPESNLLAKLNRETHAKILQARMLSGHLQGRVLTMFSHMIRPDRILEIGCGSGWVRAALEERGFRNYTGMDLFPPADIGGDINSWRNLGLEPYSFDVSVAFEVVEHVN